MTRDQELAEARRLAAQLAELEPGDWRLTAAMVGVQIAYERAGLMFSDDYIGGRFHRNHELPERSELQKLRYPPTGDRELWIKYGPAGPPQLAVQEAA